MAIIQSIFRLIPLIGFPLVFLASLYAMYLLHFALRESQQLSTGKAISVILIVFIIAVILIVALALVNNVPISSFFVSFYS